MLKGTRLFHAYRNCSFTVVSLHLVSAFVSTNRLSVVSRSFCSQVPPCFPLSSPRHWQKVRLWTVGDLFKPFVFWGWWGDFVKHSFVDIRIIRGFGVCSLVAHSVFMWRFSRNQNLLPPKLLSSQNPFPNLIWGVRMSFSPQILTKNFHFFWYYCHLILSTDCRYMLQNSEPIVLLWLFICNKRTFKNLLKILWEIVKGSWACLSVACIQVFVLWLVML